MTAPSPTALSDALAQGLFQSRNHPLLRAIVDNISDGLVIADSSGRLIYLSPYAQKLHGSESKDKHLESWGEHHGLFYPDTRSPFPITRHPLHRVFQGEDNPSAGFFVRNLHFPEGQHIHATGKPLRDREGRLLGAMVFLRKVVRERQAGSRLPPTEQHYRLIVETAQEGIWTIDTEGRTTYVNRAMADMLGYTVDEMRDMSVYVLADEEDHATIQRNLTTRQQVGPAQLQDRKLRHKDGRTVWTLISFNNMLDAAGHNTGVLATLTDITRRREAELQVRQLNEQLEQRIAERTSQLEFSNRELEAFAYSVAHDLRAPLRGISHFTRSLAEDRAGQLDATGLDYLQRIRASSQRMSELIDGILTLSRVNRADFTETDVPLSSLVHSIAEQLQQWQPERSVRFRLQEGLVDRGDAALLRLVLENLLSNAWKFSRERPVAEIDFGVLPDSASGRVYFVKDNGAGFDMAFQAKLFGVFQRLHTQQEFEGTGVGLATVQRILRRHGGRIWGEGRVDQGATFFFTLHEPTANTPSISSPAESRGDPPHV